MRHPVLISAILGLAMATVATGRGASSAPLEFEHVMSLGSAGAGPGEFRYVEDLALNSTGRLLVTDAAHAWVQAFDKRTGKFLARFGGKGDEDHNLDKPEGIAVDADDHVFVADHITGYIKKYDRSFRWLQTFSQYGSGKGESMGAEFMDVGHGRLYLADAGNHRINVSDLSGRFLFDFGAFGSGPGQFNTPEAAKIGADGAIYVSDLRNDRIQVFDADGKLLRSWGRTGKIAGELKSPAGIAFDKEGNVYVTEIGNDRIQVFAANGKFMTMWGKRGTADGEFANLHGIAIDKETGLIYVADTGNNRVQVFRPMRRPTQ